MAQIVCTGVCSVKSAKVGGANWTDVDSGQSNIKLSLTPNGELRFITTDTRTSQVGLDIPILPTTDLVTGAHPLFIQFIDSSSNGVGLLFVDPGQATSFANSMKSAIEDLKKPKPKPVITSSPPVQSYSKPSPSFSSNKNPNDPVTKDDLEEYKQEMFHLIDQWKDEIISAVSQGRRY